jgi:DNA replication protein DnaC
MNSTTGGSCIESESVQELFPRFRRMLDVLAIARVDGRFARLTAAWAGIDVLVIDDFALRPLSAHLAADTLEVIEDRGCTPLSSPANCRSPTDGEWAGADALVDQIGQNQHRLELRGEPLRKEKPARRLGPTHR